MKVGDLVKMRYHNNQSGLVVKVHRDATIGGETLYDVLVGEEVMHYLSSMGIEVINESR